MGGRAFQFKGPRLPGASACSRGEERGSAQVDFPRVGKLQTASKGTLSFEFEAALLASFSRVEWDERPGVNPETSKQKAAMVEDLATEGYDPIHDLPATCLGKGRGRFHATARCDPPGAGASGQEQQPGTSSGCARTRTGLSLHASTARGIATREHQGIREEGELLPFYPNIPRPRSAKPILCLLRLGCLWGIRVSQTWKEQPSCRLARQCGTDRGRRQSSINIPLQSADTPLGCVRAQGGDMHGFHFSRSPRRINSGCVPRLMLERWLQREVRGLMDHLDAQTILDLLTVHTYGAAAFPISACLRTPAGQTKNPMPLRIQASLAGLFFTLPSSRSWRSVPQGQAGGRGHPAGSIAARPRRCPRPRTIPVFLS